MSEVTKKNIKRVGAIALGTLAINSPGGAVPWSEIMTAIAPFTAPVVSGRKIRGVGISR